MSLRVAGRVWVLMLLLSVMTAAVARAEAPAESRRYFVGYVGDESRRVQAELTFGETTVGGRYFYDKVGKPLELSGKIADPTASHSLREPVVTMEERPSPLPDARRGEKPGPATGRFRGRSTANFDVVEGTWTSADGKRSLPFRLIAVAASETVETRRDDDRRATATYPVFTVDGVLERHVTRTLRTESAEWLKDLRAEWDRDDKAARDPKAKADPKVRRIDVESTDWSVAWYAEGVVSLRGLTYWDGGGAHPNHALSGRTFILSGGKAAEAKLADLFRRGSDWRRAVAGLVMADLRRQKASLVLGGEVKDLSEKDLAAWVVTPAGIEFDFSPYAVGCYAEGSFTVALPWEKVSALLDPAGPMGKFAKR
jgi:hypothetical protein